MNPENTYILSIITFLPLIGALFLVFIPNREEGIHKNTAFIWSLLTFLFSLVLIPLFNSDNGGMQMVEKITWIKSLGLNYQLGIDGISLWLVILTTFLTPIVILNGYSSVKEHIKEYMIFMLMLETAMLGTLLSIDIFLFYIFWELMLLPMYFLIGIWGGKKRIYAAVKFFIFTMAGSIFMLIALIFVYILYVKQFGHGTGDITELYKISIGATAQNWLFAAFALAFAIKVPMFPVHTWLPDAHTEAPTGGSVILAGVMLKMGTYGFLRFAIPLFPAGAYHFMPLIAILAVIGIIYGALVALVQPDIKRLVAYSSISHLGFVMLGIAAFTDKSLAGSIYQMLNHGVSTGALFLLVGVIYERRHTRLISQFGGIAKIMPVYAVFFMIATLSSIGLPGLNGFIGEFLILLGSFGSGILNQSAGLTNLPAGITFSRILVFFAATGVILSAGYMLWMFQRVMFGPVTKKENTELKDFNFRETMMLLPLIILMFVMGVFPGFFIKRMESSVNQLMDNFRTGYHKTAMMDDNHDADKNFIVSIERGDK